MPVSLSLCMIVRNEEAVLGRCLASVAGVVDEIVVVDTGSTDGTVAVARDHGATVLAHDFARADFAAARNRGLAAAGGDFALVLDADEVLDPASAPAVRDCVAAGGNLGYVVTRRNHQPGTGTPRVDHAVRLFPAYHRYRHRVHETVDEAILATGGRLVRSGIVIDHVLPSARVRRAKGRRYLALLLEELTEAPDDVDRLVFLAAEYHNLGMFAEATAVRERIAARRPGDVEALLEVALCHFLFADDRARARAEVAEALRLRPADPEALALLGAIDRAAGSAPSPA